MRIIKIPKDNTLEQIVNKFPKKVTEVTRWMGYVEIFEEGTLCLWSRGEMDNAFYCEFDASFLMENGITVSGQPVECIEYEDKKNRYIAISALATPDQMKREELIPGLDYGSFKGVEDTSIGGN